MRYIFFGVDVVYNFPITNNMSVYLSVKLSDVETQQYLCGLSINIGAFSTSKFYPRKGQYLPITKKYTRRIVSYSFNFILWDGFQLIHTS